MLGGVSLLGVAISFRFVLAGLVGADQGRQLPKAAVAMRDRARYLRLPLGIGIATGPAIVGRTTEQANLSVLGETTNLASRLQTRAEPGEIVLSEEAWRRVRPQSGAEAEEMTLKGFDSPVRAYRVTRG